MLPNYKVENSLNKEKNDDEISLLTFEQKEPRVTISERELIIPYQLEEIGVENDNNVERIYFEIPRYFDEVNDLSEFTIYINYLNANQEPNKYHCDDIEIEGDNIVFSWLTSEHVYKYKGIIKFIVYAVHEDGRKWNSTLAELKVLEGLETEQQIIDDNPDIINELINLKPKVEESLETTSKLKEDVEKSLNDLNQKVESGEFIPNIQVGKVQTLEPNTDVEITISGDKKNPQLNISIPKGEKGNTGDGFSIYKTYPSIIQMQMDKDNVEEGKFVLITSNVEDEDNAKLYVKSSNDFTFLTDLSGATGINGIGILSIEKTSSSENVDNYTIKYTNETTTTFQVTNGKSAYQIALDNGFVGTEQEWLDSLDYEHSDEFTQLANQVKQDAQTSTQAVETVTQIKTDVEDKAIEFEQTVQNANDDFDNKVNQVNSDLDTKIQQANTTIDEKVTEATNQATKAKEEADRATLATDGKLDKNQGTDNVGKVMIVGEDGELTPTEYKSGSDNKLIGTVAKSENPNITDGYQTEMMNLKLYGKSTQETTTGKNLLEGLELGVFDDNGDYTSATNSYVNMNRYIEVDVGKKIVFSSNGKVIAVAVYFYDSDKKFIRKDQTGNPISQEGDKYINFVVLKNNVTFNNQLELSDSSTPSSYEPYTGGQPSPNPQYPQPITAISQFEGSVFAKNLFNLNVDNLFNKIGNGTIENYENGVKFSFSNIRDLTYQLNIKLEKNTQYTVEFDMIRNADETNQHYSILNIVVQNEIWYGGTRIYSKDLINNHAKLTFVTDAELETFIYISGNNQGLSTGYTIITNFIIAKGSTDTSYTPYQEPIPFTYIPTNPMYSTQDGSISDYVDVEKGVEVYNIGIATNLAQENWVINSQNDEFIKFQLNNYPLMNNVIDNPILCNMFTQININQADLLKQEGIAKGSNGYVLQIVLSKSRGILTVENFKTFIQEMVVVYLLASPTEIPINPIQLAILKVLYTYNGVTNFLCNTPVSFDYEQSLQIVIQNIWNAIGQTNANILLNGGNQ